MRRLLLVALGVTLAVLAQSYFARTTASTDAIVLFILAGVCVAIAIGPAAWPATPQPAARPASGARSERARRSGALAVAGAALIGLAASLQLHAGWSRSLADGALLFCLAAILAVYGFSRLEGWLFVTNAMAVLRSLWRDKWTTLALAAILVFAAWMRLGMLDYYPPAGGVGFVDEAQFGKAAVEILEGQRPWMFLSSIYPAALFFKLFGASMLVLRLPFALFGLAMIIPFYLLARLMVDRAPALAATLLFAASRWDATINRNILPVNPESLLGLLAFYFLYRALRSGGGMSYTLAGVCTALGLYGYAGFRVVPVIMLALIGLTLGASFWRAVRPAGADERTNARQELRGQVRGYTIFAGAALIIGLPYLGIVARDPHNAFFERFTSVMPLATSQDVLGALPALAGHLRKALLLFNDAGDSSAMFNIPGQAMLEPITGILFGLALVCSLIYVWKGHTALPVLWFALTLIGGAVLTGKQEIYRITGLTPAIYLLIALLLAGLAGVARAEAGKRLPVVTLPALGLLLLAAAWNAHLFFNVQISHPAVRREYQHATEAAAAYIARQTDDPYVHVLSNTPFYERGMDFGWLAGLPRGERSYSLSAALPHRQDDGPVLYVFAPPYTDGEMAKTVTAFYPGAACERETAFWGEQLYLACRVEADEVIAQRGLVARYYRGVAFSGEPAVTRKDASIDMDWAKAGAPVAGVFSVEWHGAIYITNEGPLTLGIESSAPLSLTIDGITWNAGGAAEKTLTLHQGWHSLSARLTGASAGAATRLYRVTNGKRETMGPEYFASFDQQYGLYGRFFAGSQWNGPAVIERLEPVMDVYVNPESSQGRLSSAMPAGPFSAEWTARLAVSQAGLYHFRVHAISGVTEVTVDGQPVTRTETGGYNQLTSADGQVSLSPGSHMLRIRYAYKQGSIARSWLYWSPPGGAMEQIPYQALTPLKP